MYIGFQTRKKERKRHSLNKLKEKKIKYVCKYKTEWQSSNFSHLTQNEVSNVGILYNLCITIHYCICKFCMHIMCMCILH